MMVSLEEKIELASYQLKGVAQVWYTLWLTKRVGDDWSSWEEFKFSFLDHFLPLELREAKLTKFINLKQGRMSVREYSLKFTKLLKYSPTLMADLYAIMHKFISGICDLVVKEFHMSMFIREMDIFRLMA